MELVNQFVLLCTLIKWKINNMVYKMQKKDFVYVYNEDHDISEYWVQLDNTFIILTASINSQNTGVRPINKIRHASQLLEEHLLSFLPFVNSINYIKYFP